MTKQSKFNLICVLHITERNSILSLKVKMKYHAVKLLVKVQNPFSYYHLLFCSDRILNNSFVHFVIAAILPASEDINTECLVASEFSTADYSSPILETPLFRTIAATIPSPKFSESVSNLAFYVFSFTFQPEQVSGELIIEIIKAIIPSLVFETKIYWRSYPYPIENKITHCID